MTRPDLILHGGRILTLDPTRPQAEAVAVADGRIVAVGDDATVGRDAERVIALDGACVIPGLVDGHAHLDREGLKNLRPSLAGARSIDDVLARIAALAREVPKGEWIVTMPLGTPPHYYDAPAGLAEGRYPTRRELDRAAPDNPVYIAPIWGYWREAPRPEVLVSVANSAALAAAAITPETPPPTPSVTIERDGEGGALTGRFIERTLTSIVELTLFAATPGFTRDQRLAGIRRALALYNSYGTTTIYEGHGVAPEVLAAYQRLHREGALSVRAHLAFSPSWSAVAGGELARVVDSWAAWLGGGGLGDDMLRMEGMFLEIGGAPDDLARASAAPYTGWAGFHYDCGLPRDRLAPVLAACARNDIRVGGLTLVFLDLFEAADREVGIAGRRWIIEHPGIVTPDQMARLARLGVVLTPLLARYIWKEGNAPGNAAGNPADGSFVPLRSLREAGVAFALETDNVPPTLFHAIWLAVARRDRLGNPVPPDSEKLTRMEALHAATMGGAWLLRREHEIGSIAPGKRADLAVLSEDYLDCPEDRIPELSAALTITDGRIVHEA